MTYLLEHLPNEETLAKKEVLEAYLPWDKNIKRVCKQKKVPESTGLWSLFQYTLLLGGYFLYIKVRGTFLGWKQEKKKSFEAVIS